MNRILLKWFASSVIFVMTITELYSQVPQQIEPHGPEAKESVTDSPWLYVGIGAIILLIIIFYSAKKRADKKRREELNDKS